MTPTPATSLQQRCVLRHKSPRGVLLAFPEKIRCICTSDSNWHIICTLLTCSAYTLSWLHLRSLSVIADRGEPASHVQDSKRSRHTRSDCDSNLDLENRKRACETQTFQDFKFVQVYGPSRVWR